MESKMRHNTILTLDRRGFLTPPLRRRDKSATNALADSPKFCGKNVPPIHKKAYNDIVFVRERAFSTIEYALLIAVAVAALITMSVYIKRAVSGRFKDTADSFGFGRQYDPDHTDQKCYDKNGDPTACP